MSGTDYTRTPTLGLYKPNYALDVGQWGNHLNANADALDAAWAGDISNVSNVRNFGAVGDGATDDTAAIQTAANAVPASGGALMFPAGVYVVNRAIAVASNTSVEGHGATLLAAPSGFVEGQLLVNKNNAATVLTDHDISVRDMTFDYGSSGAGGTSHAVAMLFVRNVAVVNCTFQCRSAGNATAFVGCYNTLTEGCSAYGFINCAYDHWWGPTHARVVNCHAETVSAAQMVNFNPEPISGPSAGLTAKGIVLANCTLTCTGSSAVPVQVEPLGTGTFLRNAVIVGNTFVNVSLSMRGAVTGATIANNIFDTVLGGSEAIKAFAYAGGPDPADLIIAGNTIINPATSAGNAGVIRCYTDKATITGNLIAGTLLAWAIDVDVHHPVVMGNSMSGILNGVAFAAPGYFSTISTWGAVAPASKPSVTGAKGGNAALASLLTALASYGFVTDSTT